MTNKLVIYQEIYPFKFDITCRYKIIDQEMVQWEVYPGWENVEDIVKLFADSEFVYGG